MSYELFFSFMLLFMEKKKEKQKEKKEANITVEHWEHRVNF